MTISLYLHIQLYELKNFLWALLRQSYSIILKQIDVPNGFLMKSQQSGSFCHSPSTRNRYSYWPGLRLSDIFHIPFLSRFNGFEVGSHWLKFPDKNTLCAVGANKLKTAFFAFCFLLDGFTILYHLLLERIDPPTECFHSSPHSSLSYAYRVTIFWIICDRQCGP